MFDEEEYLDNVAHRISSFGSPYGDYEYAMYPSPASNEGLLSELASFGKKKRKKSKKSVGYIIKNKRTLKVYSRRDKMVTWDGKSIGNRKVYKTLSSARKALK